MALYTCAYVKVGVHQYCHFHDKQWVFYAYLVSLPNVVDYSTNGYRFTDLVSFRLFFVFNYACIIKCG